MCAHVVQNLESLLAVQEVIQEEMHRTAAAKAMAKAIGQNFKQARKEANLTVEELTDRAGVGRNTVLNLENNKHGVSLWNMVKIANALGREIGELTRVASETSLAGLIADRFKAGPFSPLVEPEEIAWLRQAPVLEWLGDDPSDEVVYDAIRRRRASISKKM